MRVRPAFYLLLKAPAPPTIYTLSLHDALPIFMQELPQLMPDHAPSGGSMEHPAKNNLELQIEVVVEPVDELLPRHRSEEHTSELQSRRDLVCRLLLEKKKTVPSGTLGSLPEYI